MRYLIVGCGRVGGCQGGARRDHGDGGRDFIRHGRIYKDSWRRSGDRGVRDVARSASAQKLSVQCFLRAESAREKSLNDLRHRLTLLQADS